MPRKKLSPAEAELVEVYQAAGEATALLAGQIELCQHALLESFECAARQTFKYGLRATDRLQHVMELVRALIKLDEAITKVMGEPAPSHSHRTNWRI